MQLTTYYSVTIITLLLALALCKVVVYLSLSTASCGGHSYIFLIGLLHGACDHSWSPPPSCSPAEGGQLRPSSWVIASTSAISQLTRMVKNFFSFGIRKDRPNRIHFYSHIDTPSTFIILTLTDTIYTPFNMMHDHHRSINKP